MIGAALAGAPALAQTPAPPSPKDFAMAASQSDQYEILAARVAQVEGSDPRVKAFATKMIGDHTRSSEALARAIDDSGMPAPPPGVSSDQAALLSSLQSVRGPDFDRDYARQQALVHAQAIAVDESFAAAGAEPNLRNAARSALPMIRDHLNAARQLRDMVAGS